MNLYRYLLNFLVVAAAVKLVSQNKLSDDTVLITALVATVGFYLLDLMSDLNNRGPYENFNSTNKSGTVIDYAKPCCGPEPVWQPMDTSEDWFQDKIKY